MTKDSSKLCDYGCGEVAKYKRANGKYCCSKNYASCKEVRRKNSESSLGEKNPFFGKTHSSETKKLLSEKRKNRPGKKHTEETKEKIRRKLLGRKVSKETRLKLSIAAKKRKHTKESLEKLRQANLGENNAMYGKHHTEEAKRKISEKKKGTCSGKDHYLYGVGHSEETKEKLRQANLGKTVPQHVRDKISKSLTGDKNPNWNGGTSFAPYPVEWTEVLREEIRNRDNRTCQECGTKIAKNVKPALCVHHIDYNKNNCSKNNLISLCCSCHSKTSSTNKKQKKLFEKKYKKQLK